MHRTGRFSAVGRSGWVVAWLPAAAFCVAVVLAAGPASAQPVSFTDPTDFAAGSPRSVAVGEFNGDSDPDLAVAGGGGVAILLGAAGGSFAGPTLFAAPGIFPSVAVGDFNGDADPDLALANQLGGASILLGAAGGSFTGPTNFAAGGRRYSVAVGDFNGDSDPDLAMAGGFDVSILLGAAGGSFTSPTNFAAGSFPGSVAVGEFNGDSDPDLAVANANSNNVSILLGAAGGSFTGPTDFVAGNAPNSVAVADFNGDSHPDLAAAGGGSVAILLGAAGGSFTGPTKFPVADNAVSVAVGDFNGDSDPDLAAAVASGTFPNNVSIFLGAAGGSFTGRTEFVVGHDPSSVAVGDFNGDAHPDLAVAIRGFEVGSERVSILLNRIGAPAAPQLTATDPHSPANQNQPRVKGTAATGSTVRLYRAPTTADCTPANLAATGTPGEFGSPGLQVSVADNSSTRFRATATDATDKPSDCSPSSVEYVEDSAAPASPSLTATAPPSPANDNSPRIKGVAETDSTVRLYKAPTTGACTPANLAATGAAAEFGSAGLQASVADNSSTRFRARVTDVAGNVSPCSTSLIDYVEDSIAPAPPSLTATVPASPANDNSPRIKGVAETDSTVRLYTTLDCSGSPAATGSAADFASPGLPVSVADNTSTSFYATTTDKAGNASGCSVSSITYVENSSGAPAGGAGPAPSVRPLVAGDKAPRLTLGGPSSERIGPHGEVYVLVECDEACTVSASATASVKQASKVFRTGKVSRSLAAGKRVRLSLRFSKKGTRAIRRALAHRKRVTARVTLTVRDSAGNASTAKRGVRLKR